jgi:predicted nucleotidyltransferase
VRTTGLGQSALLLLDAIEVLARAMEVPFQGAALRVIGREDFIAMKVFAGGPQDMTDARNAISIAGESLDKGLLERLTKRYGRDAVENLDKLLGN